MGQATYRTDDYYGRRTYKNLPWPGFVVSDSLTASPVNGVVRSLCAAGVHEDTAAEFVRILCDIHGVDWKRQRKAIRQLAETRARIRLMGYEAIYEETLGMTGDPVTFCNPGTVRIPVEVSRRDDGGFTMRRKYDGE